MKNKQLLCLLCAAAMLCGLLSLPVAALSASAAGFCPDSNTMYTLDRAYDRAPVTMQATIKLPKNLSERGGVILGNYGANTACISLEIHQNGVPRLYFVDADGTVHDYRFSSVDVRTGDWVDIAVTLDVPNKKVNCYLNGKLRQSLANIADFEPAAYAHEMAVGGDFRSGNAQYFKGAILEVSAFGTVMDADNIAQNTFDPASSLGRFAFDGDTLPEMVKDLGEGNCSLTLHRAWFAEKAPVTDYAYSFVAVGDTQNMCESYPDQMSAIYDWIVENREAKKIEYVFGLGDITNSSTVAEWEVAKREIAKLDGVVPYSIIRGNHDSSVGINKTFANDTYLSQFEGFYEEGKVENTWRTFTVGQVNYLFVNLDYGASDAMLNWAGEVIAAHPHHRVIITTHAYLYRDGTTLDVGDTYPPNKTGANDGKVNNGDQMWDKLISKHENIFLVLSGHDPCDNIIMTQTAGDHGNIVTQMLIDPQTVDKKQGATGMVAILYFSEDGTTVTVEQYSTVRKQYYMSASQFAMTVPAYAPHTFTEYLSNGDATCTADGTKTAVCDVCEATDTVADEDSMLPHSYADDVCTVCGHTEGVCGMPDSDEGVPADGSASGDGSSVMTTLMTTVLPAAIFLAALVTGYLLGKRYKKK